MRIIGDTLRSCHGEWIRLGGVRGAVPRIIIPLGWGLPFLLTLLIAAAAEALSRAQDIMRVAPMSTSNCLYWVIYLGSSVYAVAAAWAEASYRTSPHTVLARFAQPRILPSLLGRWLLMSGIAAASAVVSVIVLLSVLPAAFPITYGEVNLGDAAGLRFLWAVPLHTALACGCGVGIGALVLSPAGAVAALSLWSLLVETALSLAPGGGDIMPYLPFLNGIYATGQDIMIGAPWSPNGAMLYFAGWCVVLLVAGWGRLRFLSARRGSTHHWSLLWGVERDE